METGKSTIVKPSAASFEPTYEGWKPNEDLRTEVAKLVLSLPMRDGNIVLSSISQDALMRFEPTYEGWKPKPLFQDSKNSRPVLSLPMRDGNSFTAKS